ncbi:FprA family A-type flavoprotein [Anaerotignum sp. MSJ-24]|uniref:FprA family A-type flavoprotein n=1 Tax=Anaerotignum sp. MSJ-24 TaxID=2841521 RepID=UPI001C1067CE|nr:FprA family A-type flavoprotein [Anaerotignum sp. MSJ-24]MBU5463964.1 FprA family A-type flavoprotein [Anaerotignum sp. MSJ-24]
MYCIRNVTEDLFWIGANDHRLALFENAHPIPNGVSYNSYVLLDEKTVLFDTVDWSVCRQFLENLEHVLNGKPLDYIVVNHFEPDHGASLEEVILRHPEATIICSTKAVNIIKQFNIAVNKDFDTVKEGDTRCFGKHTVAFVEAPMVHWPEVMVTFDTTNGVLFSADAFGSFGALDGKLFNDEVNFDRDWIDDARRYYTNIVGKYGVFVQKLLTKASGLDIKMICPLHGPVWRNNFEYFIDKHDKWSKYEPEEKGVLIAYASMYGNTEAAAQCLAAKLVEKGCTNVKVYDVSNTHVSQLISESFKLSNIVLASVTYNTGLFPAMLDYLEDMKALEVQNRTIALMENGSWGPRAASHMTNFINNNLKNMTLLEPKVTIKSAGKDSDVQNIDALADAIIESMK